MARYRYLFGFAADDPSIAGNGQLFAEIPLYGVYISDKLNSVGYMNGTFKINQINQDLVTNGAFKTYTMPGQSFMVILRDEVLIFAGVVTSRTYSAQSKSVQIYAKALEGMLDNEFVVPTSASSNYIVTNVDQAKIFYDLLAQLNRVSPCKINVFDNYGNVLYPQYTGITKSVTVKYSDFKTYRDVVDDIANGDNGFDWKFQPVLEVGADHITRLTKVDVLFGYPQLGATTNNPYTVFSYPGNILNYYRVDNLEGTGTTIHGSGSDETLLYAASTGQTPYFYKIDKQISFNNINNLPALTARVNQEAIIRKPPKTQYQVQVKPNVFSGEVTSFGQMSLGDPVLLDIVDDMHPTGLRQVVRVIEYTLRPPESDNAEELSVSFAGDFND